MLLSINKLVDNIKLVLLNYLLMFIEKNKYNMGWRMSTKEQILQEIEPMSEPLLAEVLEFVRTLRSKPLAEQTQHSKALQAFLASLDERKGVYQRLADS